jgi:HSP20 family protein
MKLNELKQGFSSFLDSLAEGWQHLQRTASGALTRFKPSEQTNLPLRADVDDRFYFPSVGWSMLGGDLFEDDQQLIVRLEVPGMDKQDLSIEVQDDMLVVSGEKRFARESSEGRYRTLQCAYGSFRRTVPLPVKVIADQAQASYRDGVLRVMLPKVESAKPRTHTVQVD